MGAGKIIGGIIGMVGAILIVNVIINRLTIGGLFGDVMAVSNWAFYIAVVTLAVIGSIIAWTSGKKASGILLILAGVLAIAMAINFYITPIPGMEPYSIIALWVPALSTWPVTLEGLFLLLGGIICVATKV